MNVILNQEFKTVKIIDDEGNYLIWRRNIDMIRSFGTVDGREFKGSTLVWLSKGRGRAKESTWDKVYAIENYFKSNSFNL
ncbi:MAG TPA: hypothetical protein VIK86_07865 [Candidatus Paceibacterota bacterium]